MPNSFFINDEYFNIKKIKRKCKKYSIISFDVFDTLLKRNVGTPKDIYFILDRIALENNIKNFESLRINTEQKLRKKKNFLTIDEIYDEISKTISKEESNFLKKKEIELEISYCQPNYEIIELFNYLKQKGKKIIATSDMYLTSEIINKILETYEIKVDKIYVSCECKSKKSNGTLFKYILKKEKIKRTDLIHIGDSWKADFIGSILVGMKTIHIRHSIKKFNTNKIIKKLYDKNKCNVYFSIINNNISNQKNFYQKFGFSFLGPLIYNYCLWLKKSCKTYNIKKIFFFSRDGYLLKKIFDTLFPNEFETKYIYISRRAIRIPFAALDSSFEEIIKFIPISKILTPKVYLEDLGLNAEKYEVLLKKYDLTLNENITYKDLMLQKRFKDIFNEVHEDIINEANKELLILKSYLIQENFFGKFAVVDVGWHNSIQYYLEQISYNQKISLNMYGFYLGIQSKEKKVKFSKSFISDDLNCKYVDSVKSFIGLIESVFLANEGTTKMYKKENNEIKPMLLNYEYSKKDIEYKAFEEIKKGVYNFTNIVNKLEKFDYFYLNGYDSYLPLKIFGTNPYLKDLRYFSSFKYLSEEIVYFSNAKTILYYLFHPKKFISDFQKARWKIGFMKEVFKIPFPYYKLYKLYRKMKG